MKRSVQRFIWGLAALFALTHPLCGQRIPSTPWRFTRGAIDVVVFPDSNQGLELWFTVMQRWGTGSFPAMACARFDPADVRAWTDSASPMLDSTPAVDSLTWLHPPLLQGLDGGFVTLERKRSGSNWERPVYLRYARPDSAKVEPLNIGLDPQAARTLLDSLRAGAARSRYRQRGEQDAAWADEVDVRPQPLTTMPASYPDSLRRLGVSGRVWVQLVVGTNGVVEPGISVALSDDPLFTTAALQSFKGDKFSPGQLAGRRVRTELCVPTTFVPASPPPGL